MSYKVRTASFEGPFDLLLYLVSRQKVDIGAISITEIADQYLAEVTRMKNLDLDVASAFLLVASTLLEIKAQSLIPREREAVDEDIAELAPNEACKTFNMGVGLCLIVAPEDEAAVTEALVALGEKPFRVGECVEGSGKVVYSDER